MSNMFSFAFQIRLCHFQFGGGDIALINSATCQVANRNSANRLSKDATSTLTGGGMTVAAWARFDGSNGAIQAGYNVSSISRTSTGVYAITFRNAMPNTNYLVTGSAENGASFTGLILSPALVSAASGCTVHVMDATGVVRDGRQVSVMMLAELPA